MPRDRQDVTEAELTVMQVLWDAGPRSIRQLTDVLHGARADASQYATVQKQLERLESKGLVWLLVLVKLVTPPLRTLPLSGRSVSLPAARPMLRPMIEPVRLPVRPTPAVKAEIVRAIAPTACWMPPTAHARAAPEPHAAAIIAAGPVLPPPGVVKAAATSQPAPASTPLASTPPGPPHPAVEAAVHHSMPEMALAACGAGS